MKKNDGNPLDNTKLALLKLVRLGIGKDFDSQFPDSVDWHQLITLSARQGVITFASHGLQSYYEEHPQLDSAIQAIFAPLYSREMDIERLQFFAMPNYQRKLHRQFGETVARLAQFYAQHNIPMMLLKGHGLSLNYPDPGLRPNGDIDVYLYGKWKEADQAIQDEKRKEVSNEIEHHTTFDWEGTMVENHYDFVNTLTRRSNRELDAEFKQMAQNMNHTMEINEQTIYLPSPDLNALYLLRHSASHFASVGMNLRQVLDWGFFVEKQGSKVDWEWLVKRARHYNMHRFLSCIDQICVQQFGFSPSIFPVLEVEQELTDRVLADFFQHAHVKDNETFVDRMKRWSSRGWQYKMCFNDSRLSYLLTSFWGTFVHRE